MHKVGDELTIVVGRMTGDSLDDYDPEKFHYLKPGAVVRIVRVDGDSRRHRHWGAQYVVEPISPDPWRSPSGQGTQFVYDIHLLAGPLPDVTDPASVETFLEAP